MLKNRKSLLLLIILTISTSLLAQERTYSPHSRFGIGDIEGSGIGDRDSATFITNLRKSAKKNLRKSAGKIKS